MKYFVFLLSLILIFYGCGQRDAHTISISVVGCDTLNIEKYLDNKMCDIIDLAYDVRIVKLSTTDKSLVGNIKSIVFGNEYIYVNDNYNNGNVIIFNNDGSFVRRLEKGNGPGEISYAEDIFLNDVDSCLCVYQANKLIKFSACGNFLKDYVLPYYLTDIMPTKDGGYLGVVEEVQNSLKQYLFVDIDSSFQVVNYHIVDNCFKPSLLIDHYIRKSFCDDSVLIVTRPYDNRIFSYSVIDKSVQVKYFLELGEKTMDLSTLTSPLDYETLNRIKDDIGKCNYMGTFYEIDNYIYLRLQKGNMYCIDLYYNKTTKRIRSGYAHQIGIPNSGSVQGVKDGFFVKVLLPENFVGDSIFFNSIKKNNILDGNDLKLIKETKKDDNPLLCFFKLKDIPNDVK